MTRVLACLAAQTLLYVAPAWAADPPVPAGKDPGGAAVALITAGIDYTLPEIARALARDGEGELIGWDFVDNDRRPFAPSQDKTPANAGGGETTQGTALAKLLAGSSMRLVPVRVDAADPLSLARAAAFVARTPARVAILPEWSERPEDWEPFRQVAVHLNDVVFVAMTRRDAGAKPVDPAALGLANLVAVTAETCSRRDARETVADVLTLLCQTPRAD
jgi:hypothetical protein